MTAKEAERKLRGFAYGKWGAENYELPSEEAARGVLEELDASRSRVAALEGALKKVNANPMHYSMWLATVQEALKGGSR